MCNITIQCADSNGTPTGGAGYEVVRQVVLRGTGANQVDAPAGKFVVDHYIWGSELGGPDTGPRRQIPAGGSFFVEDLVIDDQHRIIGVVFGAFPASGEGVYDYAAYVVCVSG